MAEAMMTVVWTDAAGLASLRSIHTDPGASAILAQLAALSAAVPSESWEGQPVRPGTTPGLGPYLSVRQVAYLRFVDGAGHVARLALPAPAASIFKADGVTVDPTAITSLVGACVGTLLTQALTTVTTFDSGALGPGSGR